MPKHLYLATTNFRLSENAPPFSTTLYVPTGSASVDRLYSLVLAAIIEVCTILPEPRSTISSLVSSVSTSEKLSVNWPIATAG